MDLVDDGDNSFAQIFPVEHDTAWKWVARCVNQLKVDERPFGEVVVGLKMLEAFLDETGEVLHHAYPINFPKLLRSVMSMISDETLLLSSFFS